MRTEGQIRHKLQQVTFRHMQREVRTSLSCRPENCIHNRLVRVPTGDVRFCNLHIDEGGAHQVCDESHGGLTQARDCGDFNCPVTKEDVKEDFKVFLRDSDLATIARQYPDIAALTWVLGGGPIEVPDDEPTPSSGSEGDERSFVWKRLYLVPDGSPLPLSLQTVRFHRVIDYGCTVSFSIE